MTYWDLYKQRVNIDGDTQKDRNVNTQRKVLSSVFKSSPDCFQGYINDSLESVDLILLSDNFYRKDQTIKRVLSLVENPIFIGDIITIGVDKWLIINQGDKANITYYSALARLCNINQFRFKVGGITKETSGYYEKTISVGADNQAINLPDDYILLYIPKNSDTILIKKADEFYIEQEKYKVEGIDRSKIDGEHGIIIIKAKEVQSSETPDEFYDPTPPDTGGGWF